MAEVNGQPNGVPDPPQIAPYAQITMSEAGPVLSTNIQDGGMLVALLEQTKLFVLTKLFPAPPPLIQRVGAHVNRLLKP